ncbi:MAG: aminotransferase class IV [Proteobacteria bacterium]|nr:aminotransferase class IV [Pseudomonadota bacterium]
MNNPIKVAEELSKIVTHTRVFLSMPYIQGVTPFCMERAGVRSFRDASGLERRDGYFKLNEASLSPLDHGNLYGDAVFEGIRIDDRRILMLREHIDRWIASAQKLELVFPYSREDLCRIILELSRQAIGKDGSRAYLRPVLTRGIGNLGVNPAKCIAPTMYIVCSTISLYPQSRYERGIDVTVSRKIRRNGPEQLDPNIKTNNYLNNVLALLETRRQGSLETIMLTDRGYVAEATADNIFVAETIGEKKILKVPAARYALIGLTRNFVIDSAKRLGFEVIEDDQMLISDLIGPHREVFITGTACGLMPVTHVDGLETASERPLTASIQALMQSRASDRRLSISIDDSDSALLTYLAEPSCFPELAATK